MNFVVGPVAQLVYRLSYELEGPGSNPGGDEIFRPSRPVLGPPSLLLNWYRIFPGVKVRPSSAAVMEE